MYVLIIVSTFFVGTGFDRGGNVVTVQEFTSKDACLTAQNSLMIMAADSGKGEMRADCVAK